MKQKTRWSIQVKDYFESAKITIWAINSLNALLFGHTSLTKKKPSLPCAWYKGMRMSAVSLALIGPKRS